MDWRTYYKERLMSADEAVKLIKDNDKLVLAHDVGEPAGSWSKRWSETLPTIKM